MAAAFVEIQPGGGTTVTGFPRKYTSDRQRRNWQVTGDANYPAGGYPIVPANVGLTTQIDFLRIINDGTGPAGGVANLSWFWNRATQKLQLIVVSTGVENATADVHLSTCDIEIEGY